MSKVRALVGGVAPRVTSSFSAATRGRGETYFKDGAVTIDEASDAWLLATVAGTRDYVVELSEENGGLAVACDCPHFVDEGANCKHIWATLLAGDEAGVFLDLAKKPGAITLDRDDGLDLLDEPPPLRAPANVTMRVEYRDPRDRERGPAPSWTSLAIHAPPPAATIGRGSGRERRWVVSVVDSLRGNGLAVACVARSVSVNGVPMSPWRRADVTDPRDRAAPEEARLIALIKASRPAYGYYGGQPSSHVVPVAFAAEVCRRIAETKDAEVEGPGGERAPLRFDQSAPWTFVLEAELVGRGGLRVVGALHRGEERRSLAEAWLVLIDGIIVWPDVIAALDTTAGREWIVPLRTHGSISIPLADVERFVAFASEARVPVVLPESLRFERVTVTPSVILRLARPRFDHAGARAEARIWLAYDDREIDVEAPGAIADKLEKRVLIRNEAVERAAIERFISLGGRARGWGGGYEIADAKLPAAIRALVTEGWRVEGEGKVYRSATSFNAIVSSGIDWFDLRANAHFGDEEVPLPRLLEAARRGQHTVTLGDGTVGILPEEWLTRWSDAASMGHVDGANIRFTRTQGAVLDALLMAEPEARFDESFGSLRAKLRSFDGVRPARAPKGFRGDLRDYQRIGLAWMRAIGELGLGGCLADDMGLGKTVQVLALLAGRAKTPRPGPSLVVAPKSVIFNWREEAARFAPKLRVLEHIGALRESPGPHFAHYDLVLTTYGTLRRDIVDFREIEFDYAILDEAQAIKNATSASAKAARLLRARHRLALSGTPVENHLGELWSLFEFLNPGMFGAVSAFKRVAGAREVEGAQMTMLARALRPFILRRTKSEVAKELPDRIEQVIHCELEKPQRSSYEELKAHYRASLLPRARKDGVGRMTTNILEALLRLRQAALHPGLIDPKLAHEPSAKLEALLAQLESVVAEGHKALVFSQFTSMLAIVRARLEKKQITHEYLDGQTRDRAACVERFQNDAKCSVFLVSLKAGGVGLNLTAAEYVFLLDPWWNPAVEAQAIDRAHRIGQARTVFAYRLIATDTIEERVLELQRRKRALVEGLFAGGGGMRDLTAEDLEELLS